MTAVNAKYAKPERERRFVLGSVPAEAHDPREIVDRYLIGTRLRLRSVISAGATVYKLGQKIRPDATDPALVMHTTLYLSADEYDVIASLPAHRLHKIRRTVAYENHAMSVDEFHEMLDGLVTAEIDVADEAALHALRVPEFALAEVTRDERFTGGELAAADRAAMLDALEAVSGLRLPS